MLSCRFRLECARFESLTIVRCEGNHRFTTIVTLSFKLSMIWRENVAMFRFCNGASKWRRMNLLAPSSKSKSASVYFTQPLGSIQARMSSVSRDYNLRLKTNRSQEMSLQCVRNHKKWSRSRPECCDDIAFALPRTIRKSNARVRTRCLYSGRGRQGSIPLERWLPRETACTVHLADGDV